MQSILQGNAFYVTLQPSLTEALQIKFKIGMLWVTIFRQTDAENPILGIDATLNCSKLFYTSCNQYDSKVSKMTSDYHLDLPVII